MEQLNNALAFSTDQGLTIGLSFKMQVAHVEVITFSSVVQVHVLVTTITISDTTLEVEWMTTSMTDFTIHESTTSSSSFFLEIRTCMYYVKPNC